MSAPLPHQPQYAAEGASWPQLIGLFAKLGVVAFECPSGGLHLSHENMVFEFLRDGRPAEPGEEASLIVTNLNSYVSPLLRYSVGDLVVPSEKTCPRCEPIT